jgi:hypothetical protein
MAGVADSSGIDDDGVADTGNFSRNAVAEAGAELARV